MKTILALLMVALSAACAMGQDAAPVVAAAPIPAQILAGKKAFISNAAGLSDMTGDMSEVAYNEFYAGMKSWARYELVGAPADADVVIEICVTYSLGPVSVSNGSGGSSGNEQLQATVMDPKTHIVLWGFTEPIQVAIRAATGRKNFDQAMAKLINDMKNLMGQPASARVGGQE
jgi:hypothetical protein